MPHWIMKCLVIKKQVSEDGHLAEWRKVDALALSFTETLPMNVEKQSLKN